MLAKLQGALPRLGDFLSAAGGLVLAGAILAGLLVAVLGAAVRLYTWQQLIGGLSTARDITLIGIQVMVLLLVAGLVGLLMTWLSRADDSLQLRPFANVTGDAKLDGAADVLMAEMQRIFDIHFEGLPEIVGYAPMTNRGLGKVMDLSPTSSPSQKEIEPTKASFGNVGTIGIGSASISIGELLTALKEIWPSRSPMVLSGSLQRYGQFLRIVVRHQDSFGTHWWEARSSDPVGVAMPQLLSDIAYQLQNARIVAGQTNWIAFRHFTESLSAYLDFTRSVSSKDRDRAREHCISARLAQPSYPQLWILFYNLGNAYLDDAPDLAEQMYRCALELERDVDALNSLGVAVDKQSRHDEAADYFREAMEMRYGLGYSNLASWLLGEGRSAEAEELLRRGLEEVPRADNSYFYVPLALASLLHGRGDYAPALEQAQRAVEIAPDAAKPSAGLELGGILFDLERFADALAPLKLAAGSESSRVPGRLVLALCWASLARPEEALHVARAGVDMDSKSSEALDLLSWVYSLAGRTAEAIDAERKALELNPADPALMHLSLAGLLRKLGPAQEPEYRRELALARQGAVGFNDYSLACLAAVGGRTAPALKLLKSSLEQRLISRAHARIDPDLDAIRADPRFGKLIEAAAPMSQGSPGQSG